MKLCKPSLKGDRIMSKYNELKRLGFRFDHGATERGYISRNTDYKIIPYVGRFGIGVKVIFPRYDSTRYVNIEYYIKDSGMLYVSDEHRSWSVPYDSFKNGKYSYKITHDGSLHEFPKNKYDIRLWGWIYLCD